MRLELAERLRCPRPHEPTPLVIVAQEVVERELLRGLAGCAVCGAEARIELGDVYFGDAASSRTVSNDTGAEADPRAERETLDRVIALLGLGAPEGTVLLTGRYARFAAAISRETGVSVVLLRARAASPTREPGDEISVIHVAGSVIPMSDLTFRAAAVDPADGALLPEAVRTLIVGGRLLTGVELPTVPGVRELARDATEWVAEREPGSGGVVPLRRA